MFVRFCVMILLLSVVADVFGASVAVNLVDSSAKLDNVTDVDNSTSKSLNVSESISGPKIRDVDDAEGFNLPSFNLTLDNATNLVNFTTDEAGNGSGNNFTVRDSPPPPPSVAPENVDVQLKSLKSNVTDDLSTANSTLNSTANLSPENESAMDKRGFFDSFVGDVRLPLVPGDFFPTIPADVLPFGL